MCPIIYGQLQASSSGVMVPTSLPCNFISSILPPLSLDFPLAYTKGAIFLYTGIFMISSLLADYAHCLFCEINEGCKVTHSALHFLCFIFTFFVTKFYLELIAKIITNHAITVRSNKT